MIHWLFSRLLVLLLFLISATGITVLIGRRQSLPWPVAMLHLQDCVLPCWIGIVPGKTTIGEARKLVQATYRNFSIEDDNSGLAITDHDLSLGVIFNYSNETYGPDDVVQQINLGEYENDSILTDSPVGQVYNLLGRPDNIVEWGGESTFHPVFQYQNYRAIMTFGTGIMQTGDPVSICTGVQPELPYLTADFM